MGYLQNLETMDLDDTDPAPYYSPLEAAERELEMERTLEREMDQYRKTRQVERAAEWDGISSSPHDRVILGAYGSSGEIETVEVDTWRKGKALVAIETNLSTG